MHLLVGIHFVDDAFEDAALAYRPALMRAYIAPGVELAIHLENTNIYAVDREQLFGVISKLVDRRYFVLSHFLTPRPNEFSHCVILSDGQQQAKLDPATIMMMLCAGLCVSKELGCETSVGS